MSKAVPEGALGPRMRLVAGPPKPQWGIRRKDFVKRQFVEKLNKERHPHEQCG